MEGNDSASPADKIVEVPFPRVRFKSEEYEFLNEFPSLNESEFEALPEKERVHPFKDHDKKEKKQLHYKESVRFKDSLQFPRKKEERFSCPGNFRPPWFFECSHMPEWTDFRYNLWQFVETGKRELNISDDEETSVFDDEEYLRHSPLFYQLFEQAYYLGSKYESRFISVISSWDWFKICSLHDSIHLLEDFLSEETVVRGVEDFGKREDDSGDLIGNTNK